MYASLRRKHQQPPAQVHITAEGREEAGEGVCVSTCVCVHAFAHVLSHTHAYLNTRTCALGFSDRCGRWHVSGGRTDRCGFWFVANAMTATWSSNTVLAIRQRDTDRYTHTDRHTHRQTHRHTDAQTHRLTNTYKLTHTRALTFLVRHQVFLFMAALARVWLWVLSHLQPSHRYQQQHQHHHLSRKS